MERYIVRRGWCPEKGLCSVYARVISVAFVTFDQQRSQTGTIITHTHCAACVCINARSGGVYEYLLQTTYGAPLMSLVWSKTFRVKHN